MMDGFDLIVAIEVARKKIMLSGADISFDEINSISAILKKSADRIEELEARVKDLELWMRFHDVCLKCGASEGSRQHQCADNSVFRG